MQLVTRPILQELLSWGVPYSNKHGDFPVMRAITDGELPFKPKLDERGDPRIFDGLWGLCNSCWMESLSRPSSNDCAKIMVTIKSKLTCNSVRPQGN